MSYIDEVIATATEGIAFRSKQRQYIENPVLWAKEYLGIQLWSKQADVAMSVVTDKNVIVKAGHEVGKALSLDTPILTTDGWKTMGTVAPGDWVYDEQGKPCAVLAKSDVWLHDTYRVKFTDGSSLVSNDVHEWSAITRNAAKKRRRSGHVDDWRNEWDISSVQESKDMSPGTIIPRAKAISGIKRPLPIDPYILGAWLGDGTSSAAAMTIGEDGKYMIGEFAQRGWELTKMKSAKYGYTFARQSFVNLARELGVFKNKHIPTNYMTASISQRQELLRGLLDIDGFNVTINGALVGIDLCNELLADGVVELSRSLGYKTSVSKERTYLDGKDVGPRWRILISASNQPFTAGQYKAEKWRAPQTARHTIRVVESVEQIEMEPTVCIWVSSESHLYLAGKELIPTHNSFLAGLLICWWVDVHWQLPGGCFVVSTAPSTPQINAIVWREVRRFHQLARERFESGKTDHALPGYITADAHWRLDSGIELGYGRKPPDGKDDTMSGIHARYVLAVGDEAVGLTEALIGDLGNITSNATSRRFLICNPTNPLSYVASIFRKNTGTWSTWTISVFDSPNFHGGEGFDRAVLETLVDQSYVDDMIRDYGIESPTYISRVTGEFAWDMGFTLIRPEDVARGLECEIEPSTETVPRAGLDVSRSKAGDKNTMYSWHDGKLRLVDAWNEPNAMVTAEHADQLVRGLGARELRIDGSGLGGPIADQIRRLAGDDYVVIEMIGSDTSPDRTRWFNARAWWYWSFADRLSSGEIDLELEDEVLQRELLGIELKKRVSGIDSILLESKEDMKKRGVGSPDHADGAIYSAADLSFLNAPLAGLRQGDKLSFDPDDFGALDFDGPGEPW